MTFRVVRTSQGSPHTNRDLVTWRQRIGALAAHIAAPLNAGSPAPAKVQVRCLALSSKGKRSCLRTVAVPGLRRGAQTCARVTVLAKAQGHQHGFLRVSAEVWEALQRGAPVVALESTIISHGMPYPQNLETALQARHAS